MSSELDTNLKDAEKLLQRFRQSTLPHFINGNTMTAAPGKRSRA
jgi:hypothetical protein